MRCETRDQADRTPVRRATMVERDGLVGAITGVPLEECPSCGERWLTLNVTEALDTMVRRALASSAETAAASWDDLAPSATRALVRPGFESLSAADATMER